MSFRRGVRELRLCFVVTLGVMLSHIPPACSAPMAKSTAIVSAAMIGPLVSREVLAMPISQLFAGRPANSLTK